MLLKLLTGGGHATNSKSGTHIGKFDGRMGRSIALCLIVNPELNGEREETRSPPFSFLIPTAL